jgi:hypothetical protein
MTPAFGSRADTERPNPHSHLKSWSSPTAEPRRYRGVPVRRAMTAPDASASTEKERHLHVRLAEDRTSIYDLITEYLQASGKAPDWYWRTAGRLEGNEADNLEELLSSAFEAGAFISHDHPEDLEFVWVTEEECERERRREERGDQSEASKKERSSLSHYA